MRFTIKQLEPTDHSSRRLPVTRVCKHSSYKTLALRLVESANIIAPPKTPVKFEYLTIGGIRANEPAGKLLVSIDEPVILSLETATRPGSVCVIRGETLLASRAGGLKASQSNLLLGQIAEVLAEADVKLSEVACFAVAAGPGSFTGIRIGVATVKAFAATLGCPCIGIQTLHAIAYGAGESKCTVSSLPAGRGELFAQRLAVSTSGEVTVLDAPIHVAPPRLLDDVASTRSLRWAGEGASAHAEQIEARANAEKIPFRIREGRAPSADDSECWTITVNTEPLALSVAMMSLSHLRTGEVARPEDLQAIYVRPSDAEMNERC